MAAVLFYLFGAGALLSAGNVVARRQPVPAAVWLVVCFFFLAGEFLLLGAPFLAAIQIMVYVGAIMVLFLFVIMLLDLRGIQGLQGRMTRSLGLALGVVITATAAATIAGAEEAAGTPSLDALVGELFTTYLLPFEVTSVLLVGAIVGALTLGRSAEQKPAQSSNPGEKTIRLVSGVPTADSQDTQDEAGS